MAGHPPLAGAEAAVGNLGQIVPVVRQAAAVVAVGADTAAVAAVAFVGEARLQTADGIKFGPLVNFL